MPKAAKAVVFWSGEERFLIPGFLWEAEEVPANWRYDALRYRVTLNLQSEHDLLDVTIKDDGMVDLEVLMVDIAHPAFEHGGTRVAMISGPRFDAGREPHFTGSKLRATNQESHDGA